ncbi:MAG: hypothetical protein ABIY51_06020 [Ferruginibacter sp.]
MNSIYHLRASEITTDFVKSVKVLYGEKQITISIKDEDEEWNEYSAQQLSKSYSEDEPEYSLSMISEPNPVYKK